MYEVRIFFFSALLSVFSLMSGIYAADFKLIQERCRDVSGIQFSFAGAEFAATHEIKNVFRCRITLRQVPAGSIKLLEFGRLAANGYGAFFCDSMLWIDDYRESSSEQKMEFDLLCVNKTSPGNSGVQIINQDEKK